MRASLLVLPLALLIASPGAAATPSCPTGVVRAFAACLRHGVASCRSRACEQRATRVRAQLRRAVERRCPEAAQRAAGYPPPFDPALLAARLERSCIGNVTALQDRATDSAGGNAGCGRSLGQASTQLTVRQLLATASCTTSRRGCRARAPATPKARPCRGVAPGAVDGVFERARAQSACALADALPAAEPCAPSGAEALVDLWRLPTPRPAGTRAAQTSSYDRSGGNVDLGIGPDTAPFLPLLGLPQVQIPFSFLYRDGERFVIFDETGPGVVWRIWMTGLDSLLGNGELAGDIAFELDGEAMPRLTLTRTALFAGATPPFLAPLSGDTLTSSGGFYTAVPIAFARRLRIITSTVPNWLQIDFTHLPPDHAVASFDPMADTAPVAALFARAGERATAVPADAEEEVALSVAAGGTQVALDRTGSGTIVGLELLAPPGVDVPVDLRLRATFDGAAAPQVDAPLDDLFGASLGAGARSFAFGRDGDRYYCWFPMPFASAARLEVRNDGAAPFTGWTLRVGRVDALPPGPRTHFHAAAAAAQPPAGAPDYVMLDATGVGHVVGVVLTAGCAGVGLCQLSNIPNLDGAHLEGDERISVDGSRWPQWHGTGLEDFFGGGFYFIRGAFTQPTHGNPVQVPTTSARRPGLNLRSTYRLLLGDAVPFRDHIRFAIEHGPTNDVPADMSSLVFYYAAATGSLVESDRLTIGEGGSEAAHALVAEGRTSLQLTSAFRGDESDTPVTATGMTATTTQLRLGVDPQNVGVRLRRLADLAGGAQTARVTVNGAVAGVWHSADVNPTLRWADLEFELPAALTAGRSTLDVVLDAGDSPTPWTAFEYVALSHLP